MMKHFLKNLWVIEDPTLNAAMNILLSGEMAAEEILWHSAIIAHSTTGGYPSPV